VELTSGSTGCALLTVRDEGPGFFGTAPTARGESDARSTGLGLAIAERVARESGGQLQAETGPVGGAWITVELGPPLPASTVSAPASHRTATSRD
jgi:C4-dicarboxylate-specific signal transduction histidine kinase